MTVVVVVSTDDDVLLSSVTILMDRYGWNWLNFYRASAFVKKSAKFHIPAMW